MLATHSGTSGALHQRNVPLTWKRSQPRQRARARSHTFSSASACAHSDACSCAHAPRQCFGWQTLSARTARSPQTPRGHAAKRTCWRLAHQANPAAVVRQGTQCKQMLRRSQSLPTFTARLPEYIPCYMSSGYKSSHPNFKKFFSEFSVCLKGRQKANILKRRSLLTKFYCSLQLLHWKTNTSFKGSVILFRFLERAGWKVQVRWKSHLRSLARSAPTGRQLHLARLPEDEAFCPYQHVDLLCACPAVQESNFGWTLIHVSWCPVSGFMRIRAGKKKKSQSSLCWR